jgi:hypothetical protein
MTKTPFFTLAFLALTTTGAYAQMMGSPGGSMPQMQNTMGVQTPYIQSAVPTAPSVQTSPAISGGIATTQPTLPPVMQPQIQNYAPPGTFGPLNTAPAGISGAK